MSESNVNLCRPLEDTDTLKSDCDDDDDDGIQCDGEGVDEDVLSDDED